MKRMIVAFVVVIALALSQATAVYAWPSSGFREVDGHIFDDWNVCRTNGWGERGFLQARVTDTSVEFRPLIAFQSLGEYVDTAYRLGQQFAEEYPDRVQRAEQIFYYVRDALEYMPDIDQWGRPEYAQNADEVANILVRDGIARGDCEEFGVLLAVMYQGAGYRSAVVISPHHVAAMILLPGYQDANVVFEVDGEAGWIWLEATANTNQFGWFPVGQIEWVRFYELSDEHLPLWQPPDEDEPPPEPKPEPAPSRTRHIGGVILPIVIVSAVIGLVILLVRTSARRRG